MQLVQMGAHKRLDEYVTVPAHARLKLLGRKNGKRQHEQLRNEIMRLIAEVCVVVPERCP